MRTIYSTFRNGTIIAALLLTGSLSSCDDNDPPLPDNLVAFESETLGFDSDENTLTINVMLSREASADGTATITAATEGVTYDTDFTTEPALTDNTLTLIFPKGSTQASFTVVKRPGVLLDGDESLSFTISDVADGLVPGMKPEIHVSFAAIVATQATMDVNMGGQLEPNKVFIDLSANRQTAFNRGDWDLGFYTADGQFNVILNSSASMMARALEKNDLNAVTAADTVGWSAQLSTDAVFAAITGASVPGWTYSSGNWIDDPAGSMSKTAIRAISATDADNNVYIINRGKNTDGTNRGWKKIRILRSNDNYILQHADIGATSFATVAVTRDSEYLFNYVKFESGVIALEPKKDKWDLAFTVFTNTTPVGPNLVVPYVFNDIVLQNRYATQTAEVLVADAGSYENFSEADIGAVTFTSGQLDIGSKWRSGGGPGSAPALKTDRFYLVKDADGNIYKLKFTALTQNGERGRPQIQFALVKRG